MTDRGDRPPCAGLSVVEVTLGTSDLGLGLAGGLPGMILADLGASVVRLVDPAPPPIDDGLSWRRAWHRDKTLLAAEDPDEVRSRLSSADIALVYGSEATIEGNGLGYRDLAAANPALIYARCRPSHTANGAIEDYSLLVEARAGFCTQLAGHRPGPIFVDVRAPGAGAAFILTASTLALVRHRIETGEGGWAETSLYDGMLATLGCMIGRSQRAPDDVESYWEHGSTFPNFLYRCADDELIQVWFGGKGMYAALLEVLGDEPSPEGYYADQVRGALNERAIRWRSFFRSQTRDVWIERLRAAGVACEPVLSPGEALTDPGLGAIGRALPSADGTGIDTVVTTPIAVQPVAAKAVAVAADPPAVPSADPVPLARGLLDGIRVLDLSAFVAGPLGAQVLADLGADVIKVEPPGGEAMRAAAYAVAACQRGKRSLALDLGSPDARPIVEQLVKWADVVLHNFRVGVSARLGVDEKTVARLNPQAVYVHASAFGATGPRATAPGNDALMQALTGFERAVGGAGNDPVAATWIPIDMSGGWLAAIGALAGLCSRSTLGQGQQVVTSLLGAGMLLQSGVFQRHGQVVAGPELDNAQTGYGPGYRIYQCGDGRWLALVLPDHQAWAALGEVATDLPTTFAPLRWGAGDAATEAESVLERLFASAPADGWVARLQAVGLLVELIEPMDRDAFRRAVLDDPVNRQLGRVVAYETAEWGHFEQIGPLLRSGPSPSEGPRLLVPGIGEHSVEVLEQLGFDQAEIDQLLAAKVVRQL